MEGYGMNMIGGKNGSDYITGNYNFYNTSRVHVHPAHDIFVADKYQERLLKEKKINHRNFGIYSIHDCGYDTCPYNGMMIQQGSRLAESSMHFESDKNHWAAQSKSERLKRDRKNEKAIIRNEIEDFD